MQIAGAGSSSHLAGVEGGLRRGEDLRMQILGILEDAVELRSEGEVVGVHVEAVAAVAPLH